MKLNRQSQKWNSRPMFSRSHLLSPLSQRVANGRSSIRTHQPTEEACTRLSEQYWTQPPEQTSQRSNHSLHLRKVASPEHTMPTRCGQQLCDRPRGKSNRHDNKPPRRSSPGGIGEPTGSIASTLVEFAICNADCALKTLLDAACRGLTGTGEKADICRFLGPGSKSQT